MPDIDKLLEQLLSDPRLREGRAFSTSKSYVDEPIIRRGSQMEGYKPPMIEQLRRMQRTPQGRTWSEARLFFEQAKVAEGFEDTCPYSGDYFTYFPSYRLMTDAQLRGYFTWRAKVRRGQLEKAPASFAYVYLFELFMGIGCEEGAAGFQKIRSFYEAFRDFDHRMPRTVEPWLVDYVVDHGLDPQLALPYVDTAHERAIAVLEAEERAAVASAPPKGSRRSPLDFGAAAVRDVPFAEAVAELSTYALAGSRLYKEAPDDLAAVLRAVFVRLARRHDRDHTQGFTESLFGTRFTVRHLMYSGAVHYEPRLHPDCTYELSETRTYTCKNGLWTCDGYHDGGSPSAKLGDIVRAVDRQLRRALDFPSPLKEHAEPKYLVKIIDDEISDYLAWKQAHKPAKLDIDLSKLAQIRSAAASTCESLLIDEEREGTAGVEGAAEVEGVPVTGNGDGAAVKMGVGQETEAGSEQEAAAEADAGRQAAHEPGSANEPEVRSSESPFELTPEELRFVRCLLGAGKDAGGSGVGASADLIVDSVNEKLFDLLGDTALEFGEDGAPQLVEDYADDVREALGFE